MLPHSECCWFFAWPLRKTTVLMRNVQVPHSFTLVDELLLSHHGLKFTIHVTCQLYLKYGTPLEIYACACSERFPCSLMSHSFDIIAYGFTSKLLSAIGLECLTGRCFCIVCGGLLMGVSHVE